MDAHEFAEWQAKWILDASEQDPEVTRWDSEESAARKLAAKAATAAEKAAQNPSTR